MMIRLALMALILLPLAGCASTGSKDSIVTSPSTTVFSLDSVGPFNIGSQYVDVAAAHNLQLQYSSETRGGTDVLATGKGCETFSPGVDWNGVSLMFEEGTLTRIDLYDPDGPGPENPKMPMAAITAKGAKLGMSIEEVKSLYGPRIKQTPHPYAGDQGWYLSWRPDDNSAHGIVFESDLKTINTFRIGMANSIQYIEGCL